MKKVGLFLLVVVTVVSISFNLWETNASSQFVQDYEDIGTIKQSILKPEIFKKTQKGIWILLDGAELNTNSELHKLLEEGSDLNVLTEKEGRKHLPDALGKFIRSSNYLGKGADVETNRLIGSSQSDSYKQHQHGFGGNFLNSGGTSIWSLYGTRGSKAWTAKTNNKDGASISKESLTSPEGDKETRPVNVSMFTYIKIAK